MKQSVITIFFSVLFSFNAAYADLYYELGFEGGGDDLISTNTDQTISAGSGVKIAIGLQNFINEEATKSYRITLGYLFDSIDAVNGEAEIDTVTVDALYIFNSGPHSFGVGGTLHMSPEYSDSIDGFSSLTVKFDDAFGLLLQYGYHISPGFEMGLRYSDLDYEVSSYSLDAGGVGFYISNGF